MSDPGPRRALERPPNGSPRTRRRCGGLELEIGPWRRSERQALLPEFGGRGLPARLSRDCREARREDDAMGHDREE
jgi:hypothetical protein